MPASAPDRTYESTATVLPAATSLSRNFRVRLSSVTASMPMMPARAGVPEYPAAGVPS